MADFPSYSCHIFYLITLVAVYITLYTPETGVIVSGFHWALVARNTGKKQRYYDLEERGDRDD